MAPETNAYGSVPRFRTIMRTFVTGVSGAPFSAVVRKVASSAGAPLASNATAASLSDTRFSFKLSGTGGCSCCAFTSKALNKTARQAAIILMDLLCRGGPPWPPQRNDSTWGGHGGPPLQLNHRVHELVDRLTILGHALFQTSFENVPGLFEHSCRSTIPIKHVRVQPAQIEVCKRILRHRNQRLCRNPSSPELLAQPVSDFSGATFDVVLRREAYTTNRFTGYSNREVCFRFLVYDGVEPVARIASRVRIWKTIAQVDRNFPVVCMTHNGVAIARLPTPDSTCFQRQIHVACISGNTAAPRGMMNPSSSPACPNASSRLRTGTIRIRFTSSDGSSETKQTRNRSALVKRAHAVC